MQGNTEIAAMLLHVPGLSLVQDLTGQRFIHIDTLPCSAKIALQGAQLLEFTAAAEQPLLWVSPHAVFAAGKAARGGIPICFPWFGPHQQDAAKPAHGFARTLVWRLTSVTQAPGGEPCLRFSLSESETSMRLWPHAFMARLTFSLGHAIAIEFEVENTGAESFEFTYALHSYFAVPEVAAVSISGLDGCSYYDKNAGMARNIWSGPINSPAGLDAAFVDVPPTQLLADGHGRTITVSGQSLASAIVWNPGAEKAAQAADIGDSWAGMACLERGNIHENRIALAPGQQHHASLHISSTSSR